VTLSLGPTSTLEKLTLNGWLYQPPESGPRLGVAVATGASASIFTVAVFVDPLAAPVLPRPSVAVHEMLCVPFPAIETVREPELSGPSVVPLAESLQVIAVTPDGSVALTVPVTGTWDPLKNPAWPLGTAGRVKTTTGGAESADAIVQHCDAPGD